MKNILFIGGPWDGRREKCDGHPYIKVAVPKKRNFGIREATTDQFMASFYNEHTYRLERFGDANEITYFAYVHEPIRDPMRLLLEGYRPSAPVSAPLG